MDSRIDTGTLGLHRTTGARPELNIGFLKKSSHAQHENIVFEYAVEGVLKILLKYASLL
jgi:hypothetical protein